MPLDADVLIVRTVAATIAQQVWNDDTVPLGNERYDVAPQMR